MNHTKSVLNILFLLVIIFSANKYAFGQLTEIENRIPKNAPIKLEIKNQDSEDWVSDLEFVVTNTGKKPIYFLGFSLLLDVKDDDGRTRGFYFDYGNKNLVSTESLAAGGDLPILPNRTYTFKIKKDSARGWNLHENSEDFVAPRTAYIKLSWLSFGDGTGIKPGGTPYKKKSGRKYFQLQLI